MNDDLTQNDIDSGAWGKVPDWAWREYDSAAEYLAKRGLKGAEGDPLPANMSAVALELINLDVEAFQQRVNDTAYALAMEAHTPEGE